MKSNSPLLSVVVPISGMAGQLDRMKNWIRIIDFKSCEVVLVHDFRDSVTSVELEGFIKEINHHNLKLLTGKWGNPGGARNSGIDASSGEWITFWDSDDSPNTEAVLAALNSGIEAEVHVGGFEIADSISGIIKATFHSESISDIYLNPGLWRMIFKRSILGTTRFPELLMGEDQDFLMKLKLSGKSIAFHETIFYRYFTGNAGQLTSQRDAIKDLNKTILETFKCFRSSTLSEKRLVGLMLVKQFSTLVKRNFSIEIMRSLPLIIYSFMTNPFILTKSTISVLKSFAGK